MSELSPEARNLLESAMRSDDPSEMDRARMRSKLASQLGAAAFAVGLGAAAGKAASASAGSSAAQGAVLAKGAGFGVLKGATLSLFAKGALTAGLSAALGLSIWAAQERMANTRLPKTPVVAAASTQMPAPAPVVEPLVEAPVVEELAPAPQAAASVQKSRAPEDTLALELSLLAKAQEALRADNPSSALSLALEHKRRYPRGSLREERHGIEALARCALGHDGQQVLSQLQQVSPNSPLLERVRKACLKP